MEIAKQLVQPLSDRLRKHKACHVCQASGLDPVTVRKVRDMVDIETLKISTLMKLADGLNSMEGVENE